MCHEFRNDDVTTLGLDKQNDIVCDLSIKIPIFSCQFDTVIHAAGDCLPNKANSVNFNGTCNLCHALEATPPRQLVYISTVQVYGITSGEEIDETVMPNPKTEYGISKLKAEEYLRQWCTANGVILTILRAPLIMGTGMKGTLRSMVNGINDGYYFHIKGNNARRSIIHATDIARAAKDLAPTGGTYNITDNVHPSIYDLGEALAYRIGNRRIFTLPAGFVKFVAKLGDKFSAVPFSTQRYNQLSTTLTFNSDAILQVIDWRPHNVINYLRTHNYDENSL